MTRFPNLSSPLRIGPRTLKNRMLMGAHQTQTGFSDGLPGAAYGDYLVARARGGIAGVIVEGGVVLENSLRLRTVLRAYMPETTERWAPIVKQLQAEGALVIGQLFHSGRQASNYSNLDVPLWAPSPIPCPVFREVPKEMELEDIDAVVEAYGVAAKHLRDAGFDGIEVQACHGYLLNQFLSPYTNKRQDEYGGPLENRIKLLLRVLKIVSDTIGNDMVLGVRHESTELVPGGIELEDGYLAAEILEKTGWVHYLNMSQGVRETQEFIRAPMFVKPAYAADYTAAIKREINLPVFAVGRMPHPAIAEAVLAAKKADAVVFVRELIADPEFANKALRGQVEDIRPCIAILECVANVAAGQPLTCAHNAEVGREGEGRIKPAAAPKKVVVIGGGPAGLEAARVAAVRGHKVTLLEAGNFLGGALRLGTRTPGREEMVAVLDFYQVQIEKLGIDLRMNTPATIELVEAEKPDVVIVATGALPLLPPSALLPTQEIEPGAKLISYLDVFARTWTAGQHVVLVDGEYHALALSIADYLAERDVKVTFVTAVEKPGLRLDNSTQKLWFKRLCTRGVTLYPYRALVGATAEGARLRYSHSGAIETVACDAIVYLQARIANADLYHALKARDFDVRRAGDCVAPRSLVFAVHDGYEIGAAV